MDTGTFDTFGQGVTSPQGSETPRETILDGFEDGDLNSSGSQANNNDYDANKSPENGFLNSDRTNSRAAKAPEQYEPFTLPEGMDANNPEVQGAIDEAKGLFKEFGLSQEQAQRLVDLHNKYWMGGAVEDDERLNNQLQAQVDDWGEQTKRDPEFGGARLGQSKVWVNRAISNLGGQNLLHALTKETGVINHPAVWRAFAKIGRDFYTEDKFINGTNTGRAPDNSPIGMAKRVYPDMR